MVVNLDELNLKEKIKSQVEEEEDVRVDLVRRRLGAPNAAGNVSWHDIKGASN